MGSFSSGLRTVATDLIKDLGNACTLTKVEQGAYDPLTGKTAAIETVIDTFSAQEKETSVLFGRDGQSTNLTGFDDNKVTIAWFGQEIDSTWLYNGQNILTVQPVESQNEVIIYTITVGEK